MIEILCHDDPPNSGEQCHRRLIGDLRDVACWLQWRHPGSDPFILVRRSQGQSEREIGTMRIALRLEGDLLADACPDAKAAIKALGYAIAGRCRRADLHIMLDLDDLSAHQRIAGVGRVRAALER